MLEDDMNVEDIGPVDIGPILTRRLAWDTLPCDEVKGIMPALGMTPSSDEGFEIEHDESHRRIAVVYPLETILVQSAGVLGKILSRAMSDAAGVTESLGDGMGSFAEQNAEVALASARAVIALLMDEGVIMYTPEAIAALSR